MYMYGLSTKILWYISIVSSSLESKQILHRGIPRLSFWIQSEIVSEVGFIFLNMIVIFHGMFFQFSYFHSMNVSQICTSKKCMWKLSSEKKNVTFSAFFLSWQQKNFWMNVVHNDWKSFVTVICILFKLKIKKECFGFFNHTNFAWLLYKQLM